MQIKNKEPGKSYICGTDSTKLKLSDDRPGCKVFDPTKPSVLIDEPETEPQGKVHVK